MNPGQGRSSIDHYLVARAEARATGANAHDIHALLGSYYGLAALAEEDVGLLPRVQAIEQRLRTFCQTGRARELRANLPK